MQEPGTGIIRYPSYYHLFPERTSVYHIAANGVQIIEGAVTCALYDIDGVLIWRRGHYISTSQIRLKTDEFTP